MSEAEPRPDVTTLTVQLLSAYLANNTVASDELANLIRTTKSALTDDLDPAQTSPVAETYTPAVTTRKSLSSTDHILSLIDGKPYKTLKRHLARHGLTPESYRERYNLPATYPMVAPSFAAKRREIAQQIGLGSKRKPAAAEMREAAPAEPVAEAINEASSVKTLAEKKTARTAKPKAGSPAQSRSKSAPAKSPPAETLKPEPAAKKPAVKRASSAPKSAGLAKAPAKKSVKPTDHAAQAVAADGAPASEVQPAQIEQAQPKGDAGAKAVSARPKSSARTRERAITTPNEKLEQETAEAMKSPSRAKLGMFRGNAAEPAGDVAQLVNGAASDDADAARMAPIAKRMARTPAASPQG